MTAMTAEARRERQGLRAKAALLDKPCPKCKTRRLWPGPTLGARGKITCLECGAEFRRKK